MSGPSDILTVDDSTVYGFEKLIQKVEFENRQLLRKIDDVITYMSIWGQDMKQKEEDIARMKEEANKFKMELMTMNEQMIDFKKSSDSITRARKQLKIYEMEQERTLAGLSTDKNNDQSGHEAILQNYSLMRNDFNEKYQSMTRYRRLAELQNVLAERRETMAAASLRESRLRRLLRLEDGSEAVDFGDWTLFVVKIAEFKRGTSTFEVRIEEAHRRRQQLLDEMEHREIDAVENQLSQMVVECDPEDGEEVGMDTDTDAEQQADRQRGQEPKQETRSMEEEPQASPPARPPAQAVGFQADAVLAGEGRGESRHADFQWQEEAPPECPRLKPHHRTGHEGTTHRGDLHRQESLHSQDEQTQSHRREEYEHEWCGERESKDGSSGWGEESKDGSSGWGEESMEGVTTEEEEPQEERQPLGNGVSRGGLACSNAHPKQDRTPVTVMLAHKGKLPPHWDAWTEDSGSGLQHAPVPSPASKAPITHTLAAATRSPRVWGQVQATVPAGLQTPVSGRFSPPEAATVQQSAPALTTVVVPSLVHQEGDETSSSLAPPVHSRSTSPQPDKAAGSGGPRTSRPCFPGEAGTVSGRQDSRCRAHFPNQAATKEAQVSRASPRRPASQPQPSRAAGPASRHEGRVPMKAQEDCTRALEVSPVLEVIPEAKSELGCMDSDEEMPFVQHPGTPRGLCRFPSTDHSPPDHRPKKDIPADAKRNEQNLLGPRQLGEMLISSDSSDEIDMLSEYTSTSSTYNLEDEEDAKSFKMPAPPVHRGSLPRLYPAASASACMALTRPSPCRASQSGPAAPRAAPWSRACPRPVAPPPAVKCAQYRPPSTELPSLSETQSDHARNISQDDFDMRDIHDDYGRNYCYNLFSGRDVSPTTHAQDGLTSSSAQDGLTSSSAQDGLTSSSAHDGLTSSFGRNDACSVSPAQGDFGMRSAQYGIRKNTVQDGFGNRSASSGTQGQASSSASNVLSGKAGTGSMTALPSIDQTIVLTKRSTAPAPSAVDTQQPKELSVSGLYIDLSTVASSDSVSVSSDSPEDSAAETTEDIAGRSDTSPQGRPGSPSAWATAEDTSSNASSTGFLSTTSSAAPTAASSPVRRQLSSDSAEVVAAKPEAGDAAQSPPPPGQVQPGQWASKLLLGRQGAGRQLPESEDGRQGRQGGGRQGAGRQLPESEDGRQGRQGRQLPESEDGRQGRQGRQLPESEDGRQGRQGASRQGAGRQLPESEDGRQGRQGRQLPESEDGRQGRQGAGRQGAGRQLPESEDGRQGRQGRQLPESEDGRQGRQGASRQLPESEDGRQGRQGRQLQESEDGRQGRQGRQLPESEDGRQGRQGASRQLPESEDGRQGRQGRQLQESEDGRQGRQLPESEDGRQGRQGATAGSRGERVTRFQEGGPGSSTATTPSPDEDWDGTPSPCTPDKGAPRRVSSSVPSGRQTHCGEEPSCSPFDFHKYKETLSKLKAFSPVPITFMHRSMFEALGKDTDETPEDVAPGQDFSFPFVGSIFTKQDDCRKSPPSTFLAASPPQVKESSTSRNPNLFSAQADIHKETGGTGAFFDFASSPPGGEALQGLLSGVGGQGGVEDSSFLFSLGPSTSSSSFSFNFGSPDSGSSHQ